MSAPRSPARRNALGALALAGASGAPRDARASAAAPFYAPVEPGAAPAFPRDHGAHPAHRTEWWYLTGWLRRLDGPRRSEPLGVQVTFFRSRTRHDPANPSRFAPTQLLLAHAALALPEEGRLLHAQRAAREGFGLARVSSSDTDVRIGDWSLRRDADDRYHAGAADRRFSLTLAAVPTAPPVLQGEAGFSRKGPRPEQASRYYSRPQLRAAGELRVDGVRTGVEGTAWLDHEWSSTLLDPAAAGWDWVGLNLDDGSALAAFRIRRADIDPGAADRGDAALWSYARWSGRPGSAPGVPDPAIRFVPTRHWSSPRTGARYPVAMRIETGTRTLELVPLLDDQELDARASTGIVYWEGAVRVREAGREIGRGYLELTGYAGRPRL